MGRAGRIFAACAALASTLFIGAAEPPAGPVLDLDFPDAFVLPVDGGLVAYATNTKRDGQSLNIQTSRSVDGRSWSAPRDAMPEAPPWALARSPDLWAPEAMKVGNTYVLYFSARHATKRRPDGLTLCVGAAVASSPEGPFKPQPEPITCGGTHGVIDVSPFRDGNDLWLYFKTDGNCCNSPVRVIVQRLSPDGLELTGDPAVLRGIANDAPWEGKVIEGSQMVKHDGAYWLFYAGNDYGGAAYATGYARCDGPVGPCRDAAENPILKSGPFGSIRLTGPGHPSIFVKDGKTWMTFHGWRDVFGRKRYRAMYIAPLEWIDGKPTVTPPG